MEIFRYLTSTRYIVIYNIKSAVRKTLKVKYMTIRYQCKQIHQIHILFPKQTFFTYMEHFDLHIGVLNSIILL